MASAGVSIEMKPGDLAELRRKLDTLTVRMQRPIMRKGTRAASTPIRKAMRKAAPVGRTGNLKESIDRRFKFYRNGMTDVAVVGPIISKDEDKKGNIGWIFTFGTKERIIKDWRGLFKRGLRPTPISAPSGRMPPNDAFKRAADSVMEVAGKKGIAAIQKALDAKIKALASGG